LADLDEDEINQYILSEQESQLKEELWTTRNGSYMEEMARKRKAKEEEALKEAENPKKKKRRAATKRDPINTDNINEAIYQVIQVSECFEFKRYLYLGKAFVEQNQL
jgi:transcription factor IIIB subunit 2